MEKRLNLTVQEILDKEFHVDIRGYNANDVDAFLDLVIADYMAYSEMMQVNRENLKRFEEENRRLKMRISELECTISNKDETSVVVDNLDVLKRLSRLEKAVFQNKE